jgi:serine/threonine protein kinase
MRGSSVPARARHRPLRSQRGMLLPIPFVFRRSADSFLSLQDNVLIDSDCRARLADFGLANFDRSRWLGVTSTSSDQGGTRFYMAPELFRFESGGTRSKGPLMRKEADIYALGMLIYEVRPPIADFRGRRLSTFLGPVWKTAVS